MRPTILRQITIGAALLIIVAAIAFFGSLATTPNVEGWYAEARKVPWNPPNEVFAPTWSTLYVMIAIVGFLLWRSGFQGPDEQNEARDTLRIYALQLALNAAWTPLFFATYPLIGRAAWWIALAVIFALIASVVWLIASSAPRSKTAVWLLIPYVLWLLYASSLNAGIIALN